MSTAAQIIANRQNAQSSTGPSTPEGKAASSRNAATHGLSAAFTVLPHENGDEFQRLLVSYTKKFRPLDDHQSFLVELMVQSRWKTARLQRLEAAIIQQMSAQDTSSNDPDQVIAAAMLKGSANAYTQVQRYLAAAARSYFKALSEIQKEQEARRRVNQAIDRHLLANPLPNCPVQNEPKLAPALPLSLQPGRMSPKTQPPFPSAADPQACA